MIFLFSDFGLEGPYLGQVRAVLARQAPQITVIDLFSDLPAFRVQGAAYLLAAYSQGYEPGAVFLSVVDPGVGSDRPALALSVDGRWFVGPGNGLFELVARRAQGPVQAYEVPMEGLAPSATFHGRDLFAPLAARLAASDCSGLVPCAMPAFPDWPDDLAEIVYRDRFGNLMTGIRAGVLDRRTRLSVNGTGLGWARTFSDVPARAAFWYENANGLVEIAANRAPADQLLDAAPGTTVLMA